VIFKGFGTSFDGGLVLGDGLFKESFSFGQSLVFFLEVSTLDSPLSSLSFFGFLEELS
jgi:hypothetical protein